MRATKPRVPVGPLGGGGATRWNLGGLGHIDHRKVVVVDGRVGWVGGAGIEDHFQDGRFHDLFLRVTGPVVAQLQLVFLAELPLARRRRSRPTTLDGLFPALEGTATIPAVVLHNAPGRLPADHRRDRAAARRRRARRSTSSTPTSPTAG